MTLTELWLKGVFLISPEIFTDTRGSFTEIYDKRIFLRHGLIKEFVQENISHSKQGTLRGLHYQLAPYTQGKLVFVPDGEIFDCAVDIRRDSPTFGKWVGIKLTAANKLGLYIPTGFAHGFCVLSSSATLVYKCTDYFNSEQSRGILWNDPDIGIQWPIVPDQNLISDKDKKAPSLKEAEINFREGGNAHVQGR